MTLDQFVPLLRTVHTWMKNYRTFTRGETMTLKLNCNISILDEGIQFLYSLRLTISPLTTPLHHPPPESTQ